MASGKLESHRPALLLSATVGTALFAWASAVLPSRPGSLPALLTALLALAHLGTLLVALFRPQHLRRAWRASSGLSLATSALLTTLIAVTAREMLQRFGSLGVGVAVLLGAIGVLTLLATVPFAAWGLCVTRRPHGAD